MGRDRPDTPPDANGGQKAILLHPEVDYIMESLSNYHRREVLFLLKEGEINTLEDVLSRHDRDTKRTEIELVHHHLPKLQDANYIEWDRQTGEVSKGTNFDQVVPLLELVENHADEFPPEWP